MNAWQAGSAPHNLLPSANKLFSKSNSTFIQMETLRGNERSSSSPVPERRRMSHGGLLDSAIRMVAQLTASGDVHTRSLANRAMADLQKLRHDIPKRRHVDARSHSR
jgi:hypothetical protein